MSNDDHPPASSPVPQPLHPSNGGSQAPEPQSPQSFSQDRQAPQPPAQQPPRRTKLGRQVLVVLVTLVAVLVIGTLAGFLYGLSVRSTYIHVRHPDPTPEATAPQIEADPTPVGYQGTATTTRTAVLLRRHERRGRIHIARTEPGDKPDMGLRRPPHRRDRRADHGLHAEGLVTLSHQALTEHRDRP